MVQDIGRVVFWGMLWLMAGEVTVTEGPLLTAALTTTCLVDVPRWDFGWQQLFFYQTPLTLPSGGTLKVSCHYNTSGLTEPVTFGEDTDQEMCIALFYATAP